MEMERIRLDIIPKGLMPVCHASQYDAGRVIRLDLMDGLQGYSLTDEEIELNVRKPDGHIVTASFDVIEGQTYVDIVTTEQMCAVEGENICELKISKDNAEIYSLNFRMMVEKSVTEGGDPSESFIYNLRTQIAEGVAEEVATQYDSSNVFFDNEPTENHGIGYTVTSEGIKTAIDSEINKKYGTNILIEENNQDSIKDYIDDEVSSTKDYVDNGLSEKADSDSVYSKTEVDTALSGKLDTTAIKILTGTGTTDASGILTSTALGIAQLNYNQHLILGVQSLTDGCVVNVGQYNTNFYYVCSNASNISVPMANTSVTITVIYMNR
jgi:hypothetical protein